MAAGYPPCGQATLEMTIKPFWGVEGAGMAGPGETLVSPWIPLVIRAWSASCPLSLSPISIL
jgi:hypothetical protein